MATKAFRVPDFLSLLPEKPGGSVNPHFEEVKKDVDIWAKKTYGLLYTKSITWSESPLLCALTTPLALRQVLYASMLWMIVNFILDDITDNMSSSEATSITHAWSLTLREREEAKIFKHPFLEIARSTVIPSMKSMLGPSRWAQLVVKSEDYSDHVPDEALVREASVSGKGDQDIESYILLRRYTIGIRACFVFTHISRNIYISDELLSHPVVRDLECYALDLITFANDVYSFKKECEQDGVPNNILVVMQNDPKTAHLDLQGRLDYTMELFVTTLDRFQECRKRLLSFNPAQEKELQSLADGLIDWVIGNVEWSRVCQRYHTFMDEGDRKNNILRLELDHIVRIKAALPRARL